MAESLVNVTEGSGKKLHAWDRTIGANVVLDQFVQHGEPSAPTYVASSTTAISVATANSHVYQLMAGASLNLYIRRIRVWQFGLATTAAIVSLQLFRLTTAGTGGATHTIIPRDSTDAAAGAAAMDLPTVKGTEGVFLDIAACSFIQTVPTGGPGTIGLLCEWDFDRLRSKPIRIPAGTTNGIALKNPTAVAAATVIPVIEFAELSY